MAEWVLFYDGGCNLCHASKLRMEVWAERAKQPLRATPLQSDEGVEKGFALEEMVLEKDGQIYRAADAWLEMMSVAPWYLRWIYFLRKVGFLRKLLMAGYRFVARNRIKWFGSRECKLPAQHGN